MKRKPGAAERYVEVLAHAPRRMVEIASHITEEQARQQPGPNDWSHRQVLAHLEACSVVWQQSIQTMLDTDEPAIEIPHPRTIMFSPLLFDTSFLEAAKRYQWERSAFLAPFQACEASVFDREGTINARRHTVFEQLRRLAKHEEDHWPQLDALVKAAGIVPEAG